MFRKTRDLKVSEIVMDLVTSRLDESYGKYSHFTGWLEVFKDEYRQGYMLVIDDYYAPNHERFDRLYIWVSEVGLCKRPEKIECNDIVIYIGKTKNQDNTIPAKISSKPYFVKNGDFKAAADYILSKIASHCK